MEQTLRFAATKIQPSRARSSRIARPALDAALLPALQHARVVLLRAAAGFGKTSALAAQLPRLPAGTAVAWISRSPHPTSSSMAAPPRCSAWWTSSTPLGAPPRRRCSGWPAWSPSCAGNGRAAH